MFKLSTNEPKARHPGGSLYYLSPNESDTEFSPIIFRNDDVNPNTDFVYLRAIYDVIHRNFPRAVIMSAVSILGKANAKGAVYPGDPFKDKKYGFFLDVNRAMCTSDMIRTMLGNTVIASHGLFHFHHGKVPKDIQELSIVSSCQYLGTDLFIPPFNSWNKDTEKICTKHKISLVGRDDWKCLEYNDFDPNHQLWYMHSWRYSVEEFTNKLAGVNVG